MNPQQKQYSLFLLMFVICIHWLTIGCENHGVVGEGLIEPPISLGFTDTLSLQTATVLMDSVVTQNTGTILFGAYQDEHLGTISASGYMPFSLGSGLPPLSRNARYDSLTLRMNTRYHYGDASRAQRIRVHRVLEEIEPDEDENLVVLYNFNSFEYDPHPLAEFIFHPEKDQQLEITLSEVFGRTLFEAARAEENILTNHADFQEFFRGLVIRAEEQNSTSITGLTAENSANEFEEPAGSTSEIVLRLYYSDHDNDGLRIATRYDFPAAPNTSFTHIRSQMPAPLNGLVQAADKISSTETGNQVFIQSGVGLMTRIDLDKSAVENLHNTAAASYQVLVSAQLVLFPVAGTYPHQTPLPLALRLFVSDDQNRIIEELEPANAIVDEEFNRYTYYQFDITDFIDNEMYMERITGNGLLLSTPSSVYSRTVDRVVLGDGNHSRYQMVMTIVVAELY